MHQSKIVKKTLRKKLKIKKKKKKKEKLFAHRWVAPHFF